MRRASWWSETLTMRFAWAALAGGIVLVFVLVLPALGDWIGDRAAALLKPSFAMALLAGLLLVGHDRLTVLHRRHDKGGD